MDSEQVTALGYCLKYAQQHVFNGKLTMQEAVDRLEEKIEKEGLAGLCESRSSVAAMAAPRRQEIFACLNGSWADGVGRGRRLNVLTGMFNRLFFIGGVQRS